MQTAALAAEDELVGENRLAIAVGLGPVIDQGKLVDLDRVGENTRPTELQIVVAADFVDFETPENSASVAAAAAV